MSEVSPQALMSALAMPLTELRERVDLVERLAIASRHAVLTGSGSASPSATTGAGSPSSSQAATAGKGAQAGAASAPKPAAAKPAAAAAKPAPAASETADLDAAFGDGGDAAASGGGGDFADALGDGDDMLAGFVPDITPEDAKAAAVKIAGQVIAKKEQSELAIARTIMQKFGVSKVSDVPNERAVELMTEFKTGFPQYAG